MGRRRVGERRKQFTSTMQVRLYDALQEESERTYVPISRLLDKAVQQYLALNQEPKTHPNI
jgi:hypothetical protein